MPLPILILRPEPGNAATAEKVRALGMTAISCPLFESHAIPWHCPDTADCDGVILTSANAVRNAGPQLSTLLHLPVYAVGPATAQAAREAGFEQVNVGPSNLKALIEQIESCTRSQRFLHLCGKDHVQTGDHKLSINYHNIYEMREIWFDDTARNTLRLPAIVLLHSPRTAARFAALVGDEAEVRAAITIISISEEAARLAGKGWQRVAIADEPRNEAMLTLLQGLATAEEECNE